MRERTLLAPGQQFHARYYRPALPDRSRQLSEQLELFLSRLVSLLQADTIETLHELDLSLTQARVMFTLHQHEAVMPITQIASCLGASVAGTGRNIEQLVRLDLVSRIEDPHDRRVKLISLAPQGVELIGQRMEHSRRTLHAFIGRLPEADAARLAGALEPILSGDALPPTKKESNDH